MQRKKTLTLIGVFLVTLPISYITAAFLPQFSVRISDSLICLGVYVVTAAEIAYVSITILTSLFFTFIAWLFLNVEKDLKVPMEVGE